VHDAFPSSLARLSLIANHKIQIMNLLANAILIAILTLVVFATPLYAQTDFSGTWTLKEKQHIKGPDYSNGAPAAFTVQQNKDSIVIVYTDGNSRATFSQNGKVSASVGAQSGRKVKRSLKWSEDKKSVTFTSEIYKVGNDREIELTRIDKWSLSPDRKQLNLHRQSVETITESWEVKGVYDRGK
jgi:hypothetical protein